MTKHLTIASLALILSCGTTMAFAGSNTDVNQVLDGVQSALNSISVNGNQSNVKQSATNAANLISEQSNLSTVGQSAAGSQTATNSAVTEFGIWNKIVQDATNVANNLDLTKTNSNGKVTDSWNVATVTQSAAGAQQATNGVVFTQGIDLNSDHSKQNATNAANLISVGDITTGVSQTFSGGSQYASDSATIRSGVTPGAGEIANLAQAAANVANSINADSVKTLSQTATAPQTALNTVTFGPAQGTIGSLGLPSLSSSSQDATDVANVASLDTLTHNSSQLATLTQRAANSATYVGGTGTPGVIGKIVDFKQTGTNAANILTANTLPSLSGVTEVAQTAGSGFSQSVSNSISSLSGAGTYLDHVGQSATNVVNSLSLP